MSFPRSCIVLALFQFCLLDAPLAALPSTRPNVILIVADDLGYSDLGCYGGEIRTPNLDRLASEGIRFTQFYNNAKCTQTRAALLSGLYHHQTRGDLRGKNHVTVAEILRRAGYRTLMSGKWHLSRTPPDRGFDRFFGFLAGAVNYFTGRDFATGRNLMRLDREVYEPPTGGFYTTDAFTDRAMEFIDEASADEKPFFLYLAHNAPHFPLQAPAVDIERYRGKYMQGWDALRRRRHARMRELGVIPEDCPLSPRDAIVPAWETLGEEEKRDEDQLMAVYAAMVDRLDQNIGRLLGYLDDRDLAENTLVIFFSDNGACPYRFNRTPDLPAGPAESYRTYDSEWANASNTPLRLYKQWSHEGGVSTPCIARWPEGLRSPGRITSEVAHLIDILPTLIDLCGAGYPVEVDGESIVPLEGVSLRPVFEGKGLEREGPIFFEYRGNRAVREGRWKLVAERSKGWELYDLREDRVELVDLARSEAARARRLADLYDSWAARVGARSDEVSRSMRPSTQPR